MKEKQAAYLFSAVLATIACLWLVGCAGSPSSPGSEGEVAEPAPTSQPTRTPEPTPTPEPSAGATRTWEKDHSVMVYVPSGEFVMGITEDNDAHYLDHERPKHTIHLDGFWIDQTEVTNAQFRKCVEDGGCDPPTPCNIMKPTEDAYNDAEKLDHPVVCTSWEDAAGYCGWSGKQLPTEAEWEKACRGTAGKLRPWGDEWDTTKANTIESRIRQTTSVGSYPEGASPYGVLDMIGNAEEWVSDWYDKDYYAQSPVRNPTGPESGIGKTLRGAPFSYISDGPNVFASKRCSWRDFIHPASRFTHSGFRCALRPESAP